MLATVIAGVMGYSAAREPTGAFVPINFLINCPFLFKTLIHRRRFDWATFQPIEMRKGYFVTQTVIFLGFGDLPFFDSIGSKPSGIVITH